MIRDTLDLVNLFTGAVVPGTAGEAHVKNVRELAVVPVVHQFEVETVEGLVFSVVVAPAPFPLVPPGRGPRETAAEHVRNALQDLKAHAGSPHPSATDAVNGAIARLELALEELKGGK